MVRGKKNKDLITTQLFLSATLFLLVGAFLTQSPLVLFENPKNTVPQSPPQAVINNKARVIIDFGDKKRIFEGAILNGQSAADTLKQAAMAGKLDLKWNEVGRTPRLVGIDEFTNGSKFWSAYLNGKELTVSLYETKINPNDEITLEYK